MSERCTPTRTGAEVAEVAELLRQHAEPETLADVVASYRDQVDRGRLLESGAAARLREWARSRSHPISEERALELIRTGVHSGAQLLDELFSQPIELPDPRATAVEAVSWAETMEHGRLGHDLATSVVAAIEDAGLTFTWKV